MTRKYTLLPALKDEIFSITEDVDNSIRRSLDQFFSNTFPSLEPGPLLGGAFNFPRLNVIKKSDHFLVQASVPGYTRDELTVEMEKKDDYHLLTVAGKKQPVTETHESRDYLCHEIKSSQFRRTVLLSDISSDKIETKLDMGILTIKIPKAIPPPTNVIKIDIK